MSSRLLPVALLLVLGSAVAMAGLPCKTSEEALAEAVTGLFLAQQAAAARCDEVLGVEAHRALDGKVRALFKPQIDAAKRTRAAYFVRAFGADGDAQRQRADALMADLLNSALVADAQTCGRLKAELERRRTGGWEPILKRLHRRLEGIAEGDRNVCKS